MRQKWRSYGLSDRNTHQADFSWEHAAQQVEKEWSDYHRKPTTFYPLCAYADIFQIPTSPIHSSWLLAAVDAMHMLWHIQGDGQPLHEVYHLIRVFDQLCNRVKLSIPGVEALRMTREPLTTLRDIH